MSRILNAESGKGAAPIEKVRIREEDGKTITISIKDADSMYNHRMDAYQLSSQDITEGNAFIAVTKDYIYVNDNIDLLYSDPAQSFACTSTNINTNTENDMTVASCLI